MSVTYTTPSCLLTCTNPSHDRNAKLKLLLNLCFLRLAFLITVVPINNLIIMIPIIVIIPYIYLLLSNKPIRDKLQGRRIIFYCLITHFLCFKVIMSIVQQLWVYFQGLYTHFLCFKTVRDKKKCCWVFAHCLITYFLRHDVIRNIV